MLPRSKIIIINSLISKALIYNEISYEDIITIINEETNYLELKESIKMKKSQRSEIERNKLIEDGKIKSIDEINRLNETVIYIVSSNTVILLKM